MGSHSAAVHTGSSGKGARVLALNSFPTLGDTGLACMSACAQHLAVACGCMSRRMARGTRSSPMRAPVSQCASGGSTAKPSPQCASGGSTLNRKCMHSDGLP
eukprot:254171-Chlamydomonas_euryale.AAC.2